jgi:hypothetical protein
MKCSKNINKYTSRLKMNKLLINTLLILLTSISSIYASGGFGGGGVGQIPQGKDREKFHLGKSVYNQEIEFSAIDKSKEVSQAERLDYLQGSLPNTEKRRVNLPDLAGKLTDEQIDALEYFISIRFNVKLEKK